MNIFSVSLEKKTQCIRHPSHDNLFVIPYVRNRLIFAELVARAIEDLGFEMVVVDMPYFMNESFFWKAVADIFPSAGSLIIRKADNSFAHMPLVPNDAACLAMANVQILNELGASIAFKCIDDSSIINYPEDALSLPLVDFSDDYAVFSCGIEHYFHTVFDTLNMQWQDLTEIQQYFLRYRAKILNQRLLDVIRKGQKTLFICEFRLWWAMSKWKDKTPDTGHFYLPRNTGMEAALVPEDIHRAWALGYLDDFPLAVSEFYAKLLTGKVREFDKLGTVKKTLKSKLSERSLQRKYRLSIRKSCAFLRYLQNRLSIEMRLTPDLIYHIYDAARSCIGDQFAREVARHFLEYPGLHAERQRTFFSLQEDTFYASDHDFTLPALSECLSIFNGYRLNAYIKKDSCQQIIERISLLDKVMPGLTIKERQELGSDLGARWAIQDDYSLHELACSQVRRAAERSIVRQKLRKKRSWGEMGAGIDWKATIKAKAEGEDAIYVKERVANKYPKACRFDEFTPVVFIFSNTFDNNHFGAIFDPNLTKRNIELSNRKFPYQTAPPPDHVYSIYYSSSKRDLLCGGHISKENISAIAFLYTLHTMGTVRYAAIVQKPQSFQCRTDPSYDHDLTVFSLSERHVAWAVKYALKAVLVVATEEWLPSKDLERYSDSSGVKLIHIPLSTFSEEFIERIRSLYLTSTSLKKHPDRDRIVKRFIS